MVFDNIFVEIESTLEQLITNAQAMKDIDLCKEEINAFQKTQESLLAHLIHMDKMLETKKSDLKINENKSKRSNIQKKLIQFSKLNENFINKISPNISLVELHKKTKLK